MYLIYLYAFKYIPGVVYECGRFDADLCMYEQSMLMPPEALLCVCVCVCVCVMSECGMCNACVCEYVSVPAHMPYIAISALQHKV